MYLLLYIYLVFSAYENNLFTELVTAIDIFIQVINDDSLMIKMYILTVLP